MLARHHIEIEQLERRSISIEAEHVHRRVRVLLAKPFEHRVRQDQSTHFREKDNEDASHLWRRTGFAIQTVQQREKPAKGRTEKPVHPSLTIDTQQARSILACPRHFGHCRRAPPDPDAASVGSAQRHPGRTDCRSRRIPAVTASAGRDRLEDALG